MKSKLILLYIFLVIDNSIAIFRSNIFSTHISSNTNIGDVGEPLFLTPYIESGNISEARRLSRVESLPDAPNITSFSGYLTVNKTYNSNTFFWFIPAQNGNKDAPVFLWLDGGPGVSSLFSLFIETGPLVIRKDLKAERRQYTWTQEFSVLYIDNPVGTGYSFTEDDQGYAKDENDVARDLYPALQQFFTMFSEHRKNDFYIVGESYGGKYVPAIAYKIHSEGLKANINLKGIMIGAGWCDPITQLGFGKHLFQIGLLDEKQKNYFIGEEEKIIKLVEDKQYLKALEVFDPLIFNPSLKTYYRNATGMSVFYNMLQSEDPVEYTYFPKYAELEATRRAIHVGNQTFSLDSSQVFKHILADIMQSVKPWVETLIEHYKVLLYSGQLDIIVAAPHVENFIQNLNWTKLEQYRKAERIVWKVSEQDREVAGYVRQVDQFYRVIVRNGGHDLPYDQPRAALDMITRFVKNQSFK